MGLNSALLLLLSVFVVKVRCEAEICPRKESPPGVLALIQGSEVILGCAGDVTVDGVPLITSTKQKEKLRRRRATSDVNQNRTVTETYTGDQSEAVTTDKTPTITTQEQIMTGRDFTVSQATSPNGVGGATIEGMNMEYEDYEDNEEGVRVTRAIKKQIRWTRNGQKVRGVKRGYLRLPFLQLAESGNYSCYRDDKLISSVRISVGVPPKMPTVTCRKKSHTSKIRCEWISTQPIVPRPQCYLLVKKILEDYSRVLCSYSPERFRCWCVLPGELADRNTYIARLCVTNTVGSAVSYPHRYTQMDIIKPDPPANVLVKAVEAQLHSLRISWSDPATWKYNSFYTLQFQLRYRPVFAKDYQLVEIDESHGRHSYWIKDALPHTQYEVQLRAKDDFDGTWSEWTSPVYAQTAPEPTIASDSSTTLEPFWTFPEGSGFEEDPRVETTGLEAEDAVMWVYVLWVFGLCLFITLTMLSVYSVRHKVKFLCKIGKQTASPPPAPLQQLLVTPHQREQDTINLHNLDYFLSAAD